MEEMITASLHTSEVITPTLEKLEFNDTSVVYSLCSLPLYHVSLRYQCTIIEGCCSSQFALDELLNHAPSLTPAVP